MVTDQQVLRLRQVYRQMGGNLTLSALKAGMDEKTGRKYLRDWRLPSEIPKNKAATTSSESVNTVWPLAEEFLEISPDLEAKALFEHLLLKNPEKIHERHLRTFQRRVKLWRVQNGPGKEVIFDQNSHPGENAQLDWLDLNKLCITIGGVLLKHKLCHFVLNHSNYESVSRCKSESLLSIKKGLRKFIYSMGHTPDVLQVDNSSAATHQILKTSSDREFNLEYLELLKYYNIKPKKNNIGKPNENGDVESQNGHLKTRIKQELLLRGSNDFKSVEDYDCFIDDVVKKTNRKRITNYEIELKSMKLAPVKPPLEYQELYITVKSSSTIRIKKATYSVPSKLIGVKVKAKIHEDKIDLHLGNVLVYSMDRALGSDRMSINYRHVIHSLVRKPGAFQNYKYREEMYPCLIFKKAFDNLILLQGERRGTLEYLRILKLAADNMESDVTAALELLLTDASLSHSSVLNLMKSNVKFSCDSIDLIPDLLIYDQLLEEQDYVH